MQKRAAIPILLFIISITVAVAVYAYEATPTGYYLPKGYKVTATVSVPGAPFWPGEYLGDIVGVQSNEYSVLAVGYGSKGGILENFAVEQGIKIIWIQGGRQEVKAKVSISNVGDHDVTIVYDYDGQVKISVDGKFIYGFVATADKYQIVAQGAKVNQPEVLPSSDGSQNNDTGSGYNPPSVSEIQMQYLLLGAGIIVILIVVMFLMHRR